MHLCMCLWLNTFAYSQLRIIRKSHFHEFKFCKPTDLLFPEICGASSLESIFLLSVFLSFCLWVWNPDLATHDPRNSPGLLRTFWWRGTREWRNSSHLVGWPASSDYPVPTRQTPQPPRNVAPPVTMPPRVGWNLLYTNSEDKGSWLRDTADNY